MPDMNGHIHWWQDRTSDEIAALAPEFAVAVLPLAAIEQHGAHLPLATDLDINLGLLDEAFARLPANCSALALPPLAVGDSLEHTAFAGTLAVSADTLARCIRDIGSAVGRTGIRRLLLFNSHGGNAEAAGIAALDLRAQQRMLVIRGDYFRFPLPPDVVPDREIETGIHGGALETSLMLALRPAAVRTDLIDSGRGVGAPHVGTMARAPFAWMAGDLAPSGTIGDPTLATADMGRALVRHFAEALAELIVSASAFDMGQLDG